MRGLSWVGSQTRPACWTLHPGSWSTETWTTSLYPLVVRTGSQLAGMCLHLGHTEALQVSWNHLCLSDTFLGSREQRNTCWQFKPQKSSHSSGARSSKSRGQWAALPPEALGVTFLPPPAQELQVSLGLWLCHSNLFFHLHVPPNPIPPPCVFLPVSLTTTLSLDLGPPG